LLFFSLIVLVVLYLFLLIVALSSFVARIYFFSCCLPFLGFFLQSLDICPGFPHQKHSFSFYCYSLSLLESAVCVISNSISCGPYGSNMHSCFLLAWCCPQSHLWPFLQALISCFSIFCS
jgi:hypothetical protein